MAGGELGNMDFLLSVFPLLLFVFPAASPLLPTAAAASAPVKAPLFPKDAIPTQSGYLPVNATSSSAMYFAYYEAQQPRQPLPKTPLLVWLQGGPGCSSLLGNFFELGPWLVVNSTAGVALARNPYSWNRLFGLLFLDNPLGSGFSVAADPSEIPRDQEAVALHLWTALQAFLSSDPSFRSRPLYITGESYAGKYIPSVGYYILRQNNRVSAARRINLLGVVIGSGLTHPVAQVVTHADGVYFTGLINERQKAQLEQLQSAAQKLALAGKWAAASDARVRMVEWLENATGLVTLYDLSKTKHYESGLVRTLLREEEAKAALGVDRGAAEWEICSKKVAKVLHADVMKSAKGEVEGLLGKVRVLLYQGLYDLMEGGVSTAAWLRELQWEGLERFLAAERRVWRLGAAGEGRGRLAGYVQSEGWLSEVVVAGAGHLVPADQGQSAQVMIESWVLEEDLFGGHQEDANRTGGDLLKSH